MFKQQKNFEESQNKMARLVHWRDVLNEGNDKNVFAALAEGISNLNHTPSYLILGLGIVVAWSLVLTWFPLSRSMQFVVNSLTNIVTLLLVVRMRLSQKRDVRTLRRRLDALIKETKGAHAALSDLDEDLNEEGVQAYGGREPGKLRRHFGY